MDIDKQDNEGNTTLGAPTPHAQSDIEYVRSLLAKDGNVNVRDANGCTALWDCSMNGNTDFARLLIANGANVNLANGAESGGYGGYAPLAMASKQGHIEIVRMLLDAGAIVNRADGTGETALTQASNGDIIDLLEEAGASTLFARKWWQFWKGFFDWLVRRRKSDDEYQLSGFDKAYFNTMIRERAEGTSGIAERDNSNHDRESSLTWLAACYLEQLARPYSRNRSLDEDRERMIDRASEMIEIRGKKYIDSQLIRKGARLEIPWLCIANVELFVLDDRKTYSNAEIDKAVDSLSGKERAEYVPFVLEEGPARALQDLIQDRLRTG